VVEQLRDRFEKNKDKVPVANAQKRNDGGEDDDDDDDGEEEGDSDDEMGDAKGGVPVRTAPEPAGPVVDDDGFELVQNRRRR